ncbi:MAG: membrane protein insertion efficiency factor YidD [Bacilli bacterium]|nr:membrane protein insertion efficiency factor YidD [Bacilli bacterium]
MKRILLKMISIYQKTPGNFHNNCKYIPSCSQYAKEAIEIHGSFIGIFLAIKRILKCNPLSKGGYDPVKVKEKKK